ncbi:MAG: 3(2),5-bisphosphate nucleotidase CysQ [Acidimicrobiales bacterium]|nr:3(2),5-bisphosphate nucleotidase CysQ [Acidimicrobiales bacterium]
MTDDSDAAADIATIAGALLLEIRAAGGSAADLKSAGDRGSHELIMAELARRFPADAVLSEEGTDSSARLGRPRVWIVDPLDGTREFSEPPRTDWAVHVALVVDGELTAGAVALPAQGRTLSTTGASTPALPQRPAHDGVPRLVVSRTRPTEHARVIAEQLGAELVPMGSAGAKAMAVVLGDADIYAHSGGQYEWDSAAPVAVAQAAGLHVSRLDGSPLVYNQPDPWLPDLLICLPHLAASVIEICRGIA